MECFFYFFYIECDGLIGISSGAVRDELITASSYLNILSLPGRARLNLTDDDRK